MGYLPNRKSVAIRALLLIGGLIFSYWQFGFPDPTRGETDADSYWIYLIAYLISIVVEANKNHEYRSYFWILIGVFVIAGVALMYSIRGHFDLTTFLYGLLGGQAVFLSLLAIFYQEFKNRIMSFAE